MNSGMYNLIFPKSTPLKKDKKALDKNHRQRSNIQALLEYLKQGKLEGLDIKKLQPTSSERYRIRSGDFGIICSIDHGNKIIIIHRIAKRSEIYR